MKQKMLKILLFPLCFFLLFSPVFALEEKEDLKEFSEVEKLWELLPEGMAEEDIRPLLEEEKDSDFSPFLFSVIKSAFSLGVTKGTKSLLSLSALILISALFRAIKGSFLLKDMDSAFDFLFLLVLSQITFSSFYDCIEIANSALSAISSFFLASLPVTTVLLTLSGSPGAGATLAASLNMVLGLASTLNAKFLSPLLSSLFALSFTEGICNTGLGSIPNFFKKTVKTLCILFFTLVSAALSLNNALSIAKDSLAMRSVRFAAGNFIPVIGSLVGESAKTLSAAFTLIRTECGILCLLVLFYLILRPIFCILIQKLVLWFLSAISEILSDAKVTLFFQSVSSILDLLMALMISEGCYLFFYITLFLTNKGSI